MDLTEILTSTTQVLDWLGLAAALIAAAYFKWRGGKEAEAKAALIDVIEDASGHLVRRVMMGNPAGIVNPASATDTIKAAIKREVESRVLSAIDRAVAARKETKP